MFNIFKQTFSHSVFFVSDPLNFSLYVKLTNKESPCSDWRWKVRRRDFSRDWCLEKRCKSIEGVESVSCNINPPWEQTKEWCACGLGRRGFIPGRADDVAKREHVDSRAHLAHFSPDPWIMGPVLSCHTWQVTNRTQLICKGNSLTELANLMMFYPSLLLEYIENLLSIVSMWRWYFFWDSKFGLREKWG